MRRVLVPLIVLLLSVAFAPSATAAVDLSGVDTEVTGAYYYDEFDELQALDHQTTEVTWDADCLESFAEPQDACDDVNFKVRFKGKNILDEDFFDTSDTFGDYDAESDDTSTSLRYSRDWSSCKRSGRYTWTLAVTATATQKVSTKRGSFRIPKCRAQKKRKVGSGAAASEANAAIEESYEGEFISQVRCRSGASRSSRWRCAVVHNNNYRQCSRTVTVTAYRTDRFGRKSNTYGIDEGRGRCRSF